MPQIQPYDYQSIFRTIGGIKGLKDQKQQREIRALQLKSLKRQEGDAFMDRIDKKRARLFETQDRKTANFARAITAAFKAKTPEDAEKIMKVFKFPDSGITFTGENISFDLPDGSGTLTGSRQALETAFTAISENPTIWSDAHPEKKMATAQMFLKGGVSFKAKKAEKAVETSEEKKLRALKTHRGKKEIDKELAGAKPKFTPMNLLKIEQSILDVDLTQEGAIEKTQALIESFNANTNKSYTYEIDPGEVTRYFDGKSDRPPSIKKVPKTKAETKTINGMTYEKVPGGWRRIK